MSTNQISTNFSIKNKINYSIVIPVYKSGGWLDELVDRICETMDKEFCGRYEVVLVNDCSPDDVTWPAIVRNVFKYPSVHGINLLYNVGQFNATLCGLQESCGELVLTMDDDLQHVPEELPKLIYAIQGEGDVLCVIGRFETKKHSKFRNIGSRLYRVLLNKIYGTPQGIETTGFRIMKRELADALVRFRTSTPQISSQILSITKKIRNVSVRHDSRKSGKSGYKYSRLINLTIENIVNVSTVPLKIFSIIGIFSAGASLLLGLWYFVRWWLGDISVAGFTTQIILIIFFGGMTLLGIGLVGEYVAKIISEVTGPARFYVKERIGLRNE